VPTGERYLSAQLYRFANFTLDSGRFELRRNGLRQRLERKPLDLLILLVSSHGRVVSREEIADHLWGREVFVDIESGINTAVRKIRQALGDVSDLPEFVLTVSGAGYLFVAPVTVEAEISPQPAEMQIESADAPNEPAAAEMPETVGVPRSGSRKLWVAVWGVAAVVVIAGLLVGRHWITARMQARENSAAIASLAVLPLDNLSGDPNQQYFADGITDELTAMLAKDSTLRVISRTSASGAKAAYRSLPEIARALHVDGIVEGSVLRTNGEVHLTLRVIRADTDAHLWAESYDRDADHAIALPEVAATAIALRLNRTAPAHASAGYINPKAHDAYLRGHYFWIVKPNEDAGKYYRQAVDLQPDYALGWTGLADYYAQGAMLGQLEPRQALTRAQEAAEKAIELDSSLPRAHATLGGMMFLNRGDHAEALRELTKAADLDPRDSENIRLRAEILCALGHYDEAIAAQKQASAIDPFEWPWGMADLYLTTRKFDAAIGEGEMRLKDRPSDPVILNILSESYHWKGDDKRSVAMMERALTADGDQALADAVGKAFTVGGFKAVMRTRLAALEKEEKKHRVSTFLLASYSAMAGEPGKALVLIEGGVNAYDPALLLRIQADPAFDSLHGDPRYRQAIQKMGLPALY
jgi:TolB-like protein/DNA-binding winged helix-turn-helix (wHTH) protein